MRLIYLGTPAFAVPSLRGLVAHHDVLAVVTQPDRPRGRGHAVGISPVKAAALEHGLRVLQPQRVRRPEAVEELAALRPEIMVVVGYGQILPQSLIDAAPRGIVNVHASLLPRFRGAAPVQWAVVQGETETGVTTMQIDAGLDTGDMLLKSATPIGPDETAVEVADRLATMGAALLLETLQGLVAGAIRPEAQDPALATYAPILKKEDGTIRWDADALSVHNLVRGMQPWPGAHSTFRGQMMHVWKTRVCSGHAGSTPGSLTVKHGLFVQCGGGAVKILEAQLEGRKRVSGIDFANGQRVGHNERLGEPRI